MRTMPDKAITMHLQSPLFFFKLVAFNIQETLGSMSPGPPRAQAFRVELFRCSHTPIPAIQSPSLGSYNRMSLFFLADTTWWHAKSTDCQ